MQGKLNLAAVVVSMVLVITSHIALMPNDVQGTSDLSGAAGIHEPVRQPIISPAITPPVPSVRSVIDTINAGENEALKREIERLANELSQTQGTMRDISRENARERLDQARLLQELREELIEPEEHEEFEEREEDFEDEEDVEEDEEIEDEADVEDEEFEEREEDFEDEEDVEEDEDEEDEEDEEDDE